MIQIPVYSVGELTREIKKNLEPQFASIKVKGEVTNLKRQSSGHIYFSLKDAESQVSAVLFQGHARLLTRIPKDGDQIIIQGELSLYVPRGTYQIIARTVEYDGVGDLLLKLHQLKAELENLGFFTKERKQKLPRFPKVIGVITSPTGAVIQDILHILQRRARGFHLILNPVKVQGAGAAEEIARAIDECNRFKLADVLIVGRGGGSLEDLWAFNERCVAEAIFRSKIPIISAVGHETDVSIADFVADLRAPTPSAAAEIVSQETAALQDSLSKGRSALQMTLKRLIEFHRMRLTRFSMHPLIVEPYALLGVPLQKIDDMSESLQRTLLLSVEKRRHLLENQRNLLRGLDPKSQLALHRLKIAHYKKQFKEFGRLITERRVQLKNMAEHLSALNPKHILQKGYCIPFRENRDSVIISKRDVTPLEKISLLFHDGSIGVRVEE